MSATQAHFSAPGCSSRRFCFRFLLAAAFSALLFAPAASAWAADIRLNIASGPVIINTAARTYTGNGKTKQAFKAMDAFTITGRSTAHTIKVTGPNPVGVTLDMLSIDRSAITSGSACAFDMTGAKVNLTLAHANALKSGGRCAGLEVPAGSTLVINGSGSLDAASDAIADEDNEDLADPAVRVGAGIGGSKGAGGHITITGDAQVKATGSGGAGIGGGTDGDGGVITINGNAKVTATGDYGGAGIGGSDGGAGGAITLGGAAQVKATATGGGAGIGGGGGGENGLDGVGGTITIGDAAQVKASSGDGACIGAAVQAAAATSPSAATRK